MASSTQLSEAVARALGISEATALLHMRNVREAGILTQGGRGRSSARMTARDAAALMLTCAASQHPKDSVEVFGKYSSLRLTRIPRRGWPSGLVPLVDRNKENTFLADLEAIVQTSIDGHLIVDDFHSLEVTIRSPWIGSRIDYYITHGEFVHPDVQYAKSATYSPYTRYYGDINEVVTGHSLKMPAARGLGDLRISRVFTDVTITQIANLLRESS